VKYFALLKQHFAIQKKKNFAINFCKIFRSSKSILHLKKEILQSENNILQTTKIILQARMVHAKLAIFAIQKIKMQCKKVLFLWLAK
jgi:hypothetical protein